tara:strand:- start:201 stop:389 length:189 start_codon:yes stop_codon:yes gene_type:complete
MNYGENIMKNIRFKFLQQKVQQQRRSTASTTFNETDEFEMTPQRKEFLEMIERLKRDFNGKK